MEWPRKQIGVIKDRGGDSGLRIELAVLPGPSTDRLVCLHDEDNVGTVARVFAGQLRQGGFTLPLAVKIQRDNALTDEDAKSVAAKFDCERAAYRKLQAMPSGQKVTARLHDFTDESDPHAARLRPSIICRHALHALEPLCPKCGRPLSEPGLVSHEERRLACDSCDARYVNRDEIKHAIVRRSVRQAGACDGCPQDESACNRSAHFLNFFSARLLTFERMDLDLADFLEERDAPDRRQRHQSFWNAYQPADDGPSRLLELIGLFRAVVARIAELHQAGLTHFDLKPHNVCLRAEEGRLEIRLIDLGFADVPESSLAYLRQVQGDKRLESDYAAPEVSKPGPDRLSIHAGPGEPDGYRVIIRPAPLGSAEAYDPLIEPGDRLELDLPGVSEPWVGSVAKVEHANGELRLWLIGEKPPSNGTPLQGYARVRRYTGPAADLFSLGILLLEMLTGEANVGVVRGHLRGAIEAFPKEPARTPLDFPWTPGLLAQTFARLSVAKSSLAELFDRLEGRFAEAREVAEELFGIALRLVYRFRHWALATYVASRASPTRPALARLQDELTRFNALLIAAKENRSVAARAAALGQTATRLQERIATWRPHLPRPENIPAVALDRDRLEHNLSLAAGGGFADAPLHRLLREYGNDADRLLRHAKQFATEFTAARSSPQPDYLQSLFELLLLGMTENASPTSLTKLCTLYQKVTQRVKGWTNGSASGNERLRRQWRDWIDRAGPVVQVIQDFDQGIVPIQRLVERVHNLLLGPLSKEQGRPKARPLVFRFGLGLRHLLGEAEAAKAVEQVHRCLGQARSFRSHLENRWNTTLAGWEEVPRSLRVHLQSFVKRVRQEGIELAKEDNAWVTHAEDQLDNLAGYVTEVKKRVTIPWDQALRPRWYGMPRQAVLTFDESLTHWHEQRAPLVDVERLSAAHLGPATSVQAHLLMAEFRVIQELGQPGA